MEGREAAPAEAPVTSAAESAVTFRLAPPTPAYSHSAAAGAPAAPPLTPSYNHSAAAGAPAAPPLTPAYNHNAAAGALAAPPLTLAVVVGPGPASAPALGVKKKRGRPRKYGLDGRLLMPLNPSPISASAPYPTAAAVKRGRGRPEGFISKQQHRTEFESLDFGIISEDQLLRSTYTCLNRVLIDQERATQAILQVRQFHARFGSMGTQSALRAAQSADPVEWWYAFGLDVPELREAAVRILCQTTSSSGCERNWSTFDLIHTKRRNRLQNKRLNDLVFVHYNSRLQERNKRTHRKIMNMDPINLSTFFIDDPLEDWLQEEQPIDLNQEDVDTILSREENIEAEENIDNNPPPPPPEESIDIPSGYNDNAYVPSSWNVPEVDEQDFVPEAFYNYDFTQFSLDENMNFQLPTSHGYVDTGGSGGRYGGPFGGQDGIPHGHRSGGSSSFGGESSSGYAGGSSGDGRGTGGGDGSDTWFSGGYNYPTGWEQQH